MSKKQQSIINKYIDRIKIDYPEDDKLMIDLQQFANESLQSKLKEAEEGKLYEVCEFCNKVPVRERGMICSDCYIDLSRL